MIWYTYIEQCAKGSDVEAWPALPNEIEGMSKLQSKLPNG